MAKNIVCEDSEEDKESEDDQLDSVMGDTGSDAEKADEKPWDKDEDDEAGDMNEKNESGPSVVDKDTRSRELRAKDDDDDDDCVGTADEPEESDASDKLEEGDDENVEQDNFGDKENTENKIQNKEEALAKPPGLTPDLGNEQIDDDMEIDETDEVKKEDVDQQEESCPEDQKHPEEDENDQETQEPAEETMEARAEDVCKSHQEKDPGNDLEQKSETEPIEGEEVMKPNFCNENISGVESGSQNPHGSNGLGAGSTSPQENSSATDVGKELTDSIDLPSGSNTEMNLAMTSVASGETLTDSITKMEFPQNQSSTSQQTKMNPHRSVGDALKELKERFKSLLRRWRKARG